MIDELDPESPDGRIVVAVLQEMGANPIRLTSLVAGMRFMQTHPAEAQRLLDVFMQPFIIKAMDDLCDALTNRVTLASAINEAFKILE